MRNRRSRKNRKSMVLTQLCQELKQAVESENSLVGIVDSLKILSKLRVCKITDCINALKQQNKKGEYDKTLEKLEVIQLSLIRSGFNKHGINQTKEGAEVTDHTVFLGGNGYDLALKSVHFWKHLEKSGNGVQAHEIVSGQAKRFLDSHVIPIVKNIEEMGQSAKSIAVVI